MSRPGYWMLWSDADAMIINQTIPLEDVIDDAFDIAVSADWLMINAGVILLKCTPWAEKFLSRVYEAREFDSARALDQSAFQHFFDIGAAEGKLKYVPKHVINVYPEEYRPGDFLLHMAGKLYEATTLGATAIAHQFDILSNVEDVEDVAAFFTGHYFLNMYSGICQRGDEKSKESECPPDDERRLKLVEPIGFMSSPKRYRHVAMRYYWMQDWTDRYDVEGWNNGRKVFDSSARAKGVHVSEEETHDEL